MKDQIIAVDFDGCIVTDEYPGIGRPIFSVIVGIKGRRAKGAKLILWTCRRDKELDLAVEWCKKYVGLEFDAVNENLPEIVARFGGDTRKIYATEYWDDKAVRMP